MNSGSSQEALVIKNLITLVANETVAISVIQAAVGNNKEALVEAEAEMVSS